MITLRITNWTQDGKNLTTYTLDGDTYAVKEEIKKLGFRWGFPADVVSVIGLEGTTDPMFRSNKAWSVTCDADSDRAEWVREVCAALNAEVKKAAPPKDADAYSVEIAGESLSITDNETGDKKKITAWNIEDRANDLLEDENYRKSHWGCWAVIAEDALASILRREGFGEKTAAELAKNARKFDEAIEAVEETADTYYAN